MVPHHDEMDECLLDSFQPMMPYWIRTNFLSLCVCVCLYIYIQLPNLYHFLPRVQKILLRTKGNQPTPILSLIIHIFLIISQTTLETPTEQQREKDTETDFLQNSCWHSEAASTFFSGYSPSGNMASGIHPTKASSHIKGSPHAHKKVVREASGALPGEISVPAQQEEGKEFTGDNLGSLILDKIWKYFGFLTKYWPLSMHS